MNHDLIIAILAALLSVSEILGTSKVFADNSIFQILVRIFKVLYQTVTGKTETVAS